jgi:hypothetical protein
MNSKPPSLLDRWDLMKLQVRNRFPLSLADKEGAMNVTVLHLIAYVFAFCCFVLAAWPIPSRINLLAAGLAILTLTLIF